MTDAELIARHIAKKGVTVIPPGVAAGLSRLEVAMGITSTPENPIPWRQRVHNQITGANRVKKAAAA
jgi:hypothetical protein